MNAFQLYYKGPFIKISLNLGIPDNKVTFHFSVNKKLTIFINMWVSLQEENILTKINICCNLAKVLERKKALTQELLIVGRW